VQRVKMIISKSQLVKLIAEALELSDDSLQKAEEFMRSASDEEGGTINPDEVEQNIEKELGVKMDEEEFESLAASLGFEEVPAGTMLDRQRVTETQISRSQLRKIILEIILKEQGCAETDEGCVKQSDGTDERKYGPSGTWYILNNKVGGVFRKGYETKQSAKDSLEAMHSRKG
jgi:hypothetical protein